jgi:hypothetical protein
MPKTRLASILIAIIIAALFIISKYNIHIKGALKKDGDSHQLDNQLFR